MTVQQQMTAAWSSCRQAGGGTLAADVPAGRLVADIGAIDELACAFMEFRLETDRLADADAERLESLSRDLSSRLHYLLEPIRPIEFDDERCVMQMRSSPPARDESGTSYYELVVERGGRIALRRYRKEPGQPRTALPAQVTREVLIRLAGDFCATVNA